MPPPFFDGNQSTNNQQGLPSNFACWRRQLVNKRVVVVVNRMQRNFLPMC